MGIGNTSSASLLLHKLGGYPLEQCVGRGAGHDEEGVKKKLETLSKIGRAHV